MAHDPRWREKHWHYVALASEEAFVSAAIVQLGYLGLVFATAYDRVQRVEASFERLIPLGLGLQVAGDPGAGASSWGQVLRFENAPRRWSLATPSFALEAVGDPIAPWEASWAIGARGHNRTRKEMGFAVQGSLRMAHRTLALDGHGMQDWSRGVPARETSWRWAAGVARAGDRLVSWNLRTGFDDPTQAENALWLDGTPTSPGLARIETGSPWTIRCDGLDLEFEADGMRREDRNLLLVASRYQQPWGRFRGTFHGEPISGYGVVEDHWARW